MAQFVPTGMAQFYRYDYYYDFVFKFLIVIGVAFVLPVFLVALNLAGIMSGRAILKGWRVAILIATAFAALATPAADVTSMLLLAGIMIVLYFLAAGLSLLFDRRRAKRESRLLAERGAGVIDGSPGRAVRPGPRGSRASHHSRVRGIAAVRPRPLPARRMPLARRGPQRPGRGAHRRGQDDRRRVRDPPRDARSRSMEGIPPRRSTRRR